MTQENNQLDQTVDMSIESVLESIEDNNRTSTLPTTIITQSQVDALASMSAQLTTEIIDQSRLAVLESEAKSKDDEISLLKRQLEEANQNARSPEPEGEDCDSEASCTSEENDADESEDESEADEEVQIYTVDDDGDVNVSDPTVGSSGNPILNAPQNQMDLPEYPLWEIQHYAPRKSKMKSTPTLQQPGRLTSSTPTERPASPPIKPKQPSKKTKLKRCRPIWSDEEDSQYDPLVENAQNPNSKILKVQVTPKKLNAKRGNLIQLDDDSEDEKQHTPTKKIKFNSNPFIIHSAKEDNRMDLDSSGYSERRSPSKPNSKFRKPVSHGATPSASTSKQTVEFPYNTSYYKRNASQWKDGRFKFHHNLLKVAIAAMTDNCQLSSDELKSKMELIGQSVYTSSEAMCKHRWWRYDQQTYESMQTPEVPSFMNELISQKAQRLKASTIQKFRSGYISGQSTLMQFRFFLKMHGREKITIQDMSDMMKDFDYSQ